MCIIYVCIYIYIYIERERTLAGLVASLKPSALAAWRKLLMMMIVMIIGKHTVVYYPT